MFRPFFSSKSAGSGFGLPLALRTIEEHGGRLTLLDEASTLGGATFSVELPLLATDTLGTESTETVLSHRILVVDDDLPIAATLKRHLTSSGFHAWSAGSAEEALSMVKEVDPRSGDHGHLHAGNGRPGPPRASSKATWMRWTSW